MAERMRKIVKKFVRKHMTVDDLDRNIPLGLFEFASIDALYEFNDKIIDKLNPTKLLEVICLIKLINKRGLKNMDKESFVVWDASGFCWNNKKELVLFNER